MVQVELKVKKRETGKQAAKNLRREDLVPGVFYMDGKESTPIVAEVLDMRPIVYTSQMRIINLHIDGDDDTKECILKEINFHPVTDKIVHFDLYGITRGQKMAVEVPIKLVGQPVGVLKEGGILQHSLRSVKVYCLPKDMPSEITLDITNLSIGSSISLANADVENIEFDVPVDTVIASVTRSRVSEKTAEEEAEETAAAAAAAAEDTTEE